jgi:hypothetical protein
MLASGIGHAGAPRVIGEQALELARETGLVGRFLISASESAFFAW